MNLAGSPIGSDNADVTQRGPGKLPELSCNIATISTCCYLACCLPQFYDGNGICVLQIQFASHLDLCYSIGPVLESALVLETVKVKSCNFYFKILNKLLL